MDVGCSWATVLSLLQAHNDDVYPLMMMKAGKACTCQDQNNEKTPLRCLCRCKWRIILHRSSACASLMSGTTGFQKRWVDAATSSLPVCLWVSRARMAPSSLSSARTRSQKGPCWLSVRASRRLHGNAAHLFNAQHATMSRVTYSRHQAHSRKSYVHHMNIQRLVWGP